MNPALILNVRPPLLGQAGTSFRLYADEQTCLNISTTYIEEISKICHNQLKLDLWLSCEDYYQSTLIQQRFPYLKHYFLAPKDPKTYIPSILNQVCIKESYQIAIVLLQEFSFIKPEAIESCCKWLRSHARTLFLFSHDGEALDGLMTNFPFQTIYTDIIWQKTNTLEQMVAACKNANISYKINTADLQLFTEEIAYTNFAGLFPQTYAIIKRQLTFI